MYSQVTPYGKGGEMTGKESSLKFAGLIFVLLAFFLMGELTDLEIFIGRIAPAILLAVLPHSLFIVMAVCFWIAEKPCKLPNALY